MRTPSSRPSRSRIVITSARAWHGCALSVSPLITGIVAWRGELLDVVLREGADHQRRRGSARARWRCPGASRRGRAGGRRPPGRARPPELVDPDLERDARSRRGLLEDHPERAAGEEVVLLPPGLALLEVVGEVERRQELLAAPVGDASEMAPFQAPTAAMGHRMLWLGPERLFQAGLGEQVAQAVEPVNMRLLIVPSGWPSRSASSALGQAAVVAELERLTLLGGRRLAAPPARRGAGSRGWPRPRRSSVRGGSGALSSGSARRAILAPDEVDGAAVDERQDPGARLRALREEAVGRAPDRRGTRPARRPAPEPRPEGSGGRGRRRPARSGHRARPARSSSELATSESSDSSERCASSRDDAAGGGVVRRAVTTRPRWLREASASDG